MFSWSYSTKTAINNGILSTIKPSPMKDITSDGNNSFSMTRQQFIKTNNTETASTPTIILQKKWYGANNKDASTITDSRRISEIGNGSLNASKKEFAFKTTSDVNVSREALKRVRCGGCVVPAKKIHKYDNAPVFY
jgi:hypothetical protein